MDLNKKQIGDATELLRKRDIKIQQDFDCWEKYGDSLNESKSNIGYIYVIQCANAYKIGITCSPKNRIKTYKTENPFKIKVIIMEKVSDYSDLETYLHQICSHKNIHGEWFNLNKEELRIVLLDIKSGKIYNEN
jgi:hypothetical protein